MLGPTTTSLLLRRPLSRSVFRSFNARNVQTASKPPNQSTGSLLTSPYFYAGVFATTGIGAYFWFTNVKNDALAASNLPPLSLSQFTPASLISSEITSKNTRLLTLNVTPPKDGPLSPIWSVFIKNDEMQVERPYTPLEGMDEKGQIKLWVKKYPDGQVGRWLHSKKPGDTIELRGPLRTWPWKADEWDEIVLISGGTGITPFYQLLNHELLSKGSTSSKTRFTLLHSSLTPGDLPPPAMMRPLAAAAQDKPDRFQMRLFVDSLDEPAPVEGLHVGRIDKLAIERALDVKEPSKGAKMTKADYTRGKKVLFLVCGPPPMVSAIAGPRGEKFAQGDVKGILGNMGFESEDVRKL